MGKHFTKSLKFECTCKYCGILFYSADVKGNRCAACNKPKLCKCGCEGLTNTNKALYIPGHYSKGRTYNEIYKSNNPTNGFKSGATNPNYNPTIKDKATASLVKFYKENPEKLAAKLKKGALTRRHIEYDGEVFRSKWELDVYKILKSNNILFNREVTVLLESGKIKIVDFVVDNIYIEVTGFSYAVNPLLFDGKINSLRRAIDVDDYILLITNQQLKPKIFKIAHQYCNVVSSSMEELDIIHSIRLFKNMNIIKQNLIGEINEQ